MDRRTFELGRAAGRRTYIAAIPGDLLNLVIECCADAADIPGHGATPAQCRQLTTKLMDILVWECLTAENVLAELVEAGLTPHLRNYLRKCEYVQEFWGSIFNDIPTQNSGKPRSLKQLKELKAAQLCIKIHGAGADRYIKHYAGWNNVCTLDDEDHGVDTDYDASTNSSADINGCVAIDCDDNTDYDAEENYDADEFDL